MSWQVPVGRASASSPVQREINREIMIAFNASWSFSTSRVNAKSMVRICSLFFHFLYPQNWLSNYTADYCVFFQSVSYQFIPASLNANMCAFEQLTILGLTTMCIGLSDQAKRCSIA